MSNTLILYTTSGCHLCEQAKDIIWPLIGSTQWQLLEVDIAETDELVERYGLRIPVVATQKAELGWPFDGAQLARLLDV